MRDATARRLSAAHRRVYRLTGGRIGRRLVDNDMLLLTTRGRVTGRPHTVPLLYLTEPDGWVVIASWGGRDTDPDWYANLAVDPRCQIDIGADTIPVVAETLVGDRRNALWERAVAAYDGYASYQARTSREIPIVVLRPVADLLPDGE